MLRILIGGVVLMAAPFFMVVPVKAAEVIRSFDVTANVQADGTVDIFEKITVYAEGREIRRGIYRDIPTQFKDANGKTFEMPFDVKSVRRDDKKEAYHIVTQQNGQRIYIGSKDHYVSRGPHVYEIHYRVARAIGRFAHGDEFYWNVTGNGWVFPIYKASITVTFPEQAKVIMATGYTGPYGSQAQNFDSRMFGNHYQATTTAVLSAYEGFTVAVAVPAGTIAAETTWQQIKYYFQTHSISLIWLSFAFMSLVYLTQAWVRFGRDPKGVIIPRFEAPKNIDPDMLRFIYKQNYDMKSFTTLIIHAAAHQKIKIMEGENSVSLIMNDAARQGKQVIENMNILYSAFGRMAMVTLPKQGMFAPRVSETIGENLRRAQSLHQEVITDHGKAYLDKNAIHTGGGLIIGILGAIWALFLSVNEDEKFFLSIGSIVFYALIFKLFARIMPQYTPAGQQVMEEAEGLRMYMKTAEEERWNALYPKDMTPEKFEKLLPYAVALDVDQEWCDYMNMLIAAGLVAPPEHWSRDGWLYHSYSGSVSSGLNSINSTISSAATPPGSSSGFGGGGGFSGGGGGGGGGGGW